jgi:hypothetical protein
MKKWLLIFLLSSLLFSCKEKEETITIQWKQIAPFGMQRSLEVDGKPVQYFEETNFIKKTSESLRITGKSQDVITLLPSGQLVITPREAEIKIWRAGVFDKKLIFSGTTNFSYK